MRRDGALLDSVVPLTSTTLQFFAAPSNVMRTRLLNLAIIVHSTSQTTMFGFHVSREWAPGTRPSIRGHIECAVAHRNATTGVSRTAPFAFQVFLAGPRSLDFSVQGAEADELQSLMSAPLDGVRLWGVAHGTYMDIPWNLDAPNHHYRCGFIRREVEVAHRTGLAGVVVHLGIPGPEIVIQALPWIYPSMIGGRKVCDIIKAQAAAGENATAASATSSGNLPRIYLEVPHVLPKNSHYETPEKLVTLFRLIRQKCDPHLHIFGLCIDTAHIWACGADISTYEKGKAWVDALIAVHDFIPPDAIIFHLNDNRNECGSGIDEHDPLLYGKIWGDYRQNPRESGLAAFIEYATRFNIPTVLERKGRKPTGEDGPMTLKEALQVDYTALVSLGVQ